MAAVLAGVAIQERDEITVPETRAVLIAVRRPSRAAATPEPPSGASMAINADSTTPITPSTIEALTWPM